MSKWKGRKINVDSGVLTAEMLEEVHKLAFNSFGSTKTIYEIHADGVKEVPCDMCDEACGNDWCHTKDEQ
jgi:hypothetical protein